MIIIIRTDLKPYIGLDAINIAYRDEPLTVNCVDIRLV